MRGLPVLAGVRFPAKGRTGPDRVLIDTPEPRMVRHHAALREIHFEKLLNYPRTSSVYRGSFSKDAPNFDSFRLPTFYSNAISVFQTSQTLPTRSGPGFSVILPGLHPEGVASLPLLSLTS